NGSPETVVAKIRNQSGGMMHVRRRHLGETVLHRSADGTFAIDLRFKNGSAQFVGREAERIASIVIPKVNRFGGDKKSVAGAVQEIESTGGAEGYLARLTQISESLTRAGVRRRNERYKWMRDSKDFSASGLYGLPRQHRLALEMALHEEAERRAVEGELADLERAWREAEEIAGIADSLLLPENVDATFERLRRDTNEARGEQE
ncbi:MAG TPA: hypothetical protein VIP11_19535, partial [Gemmatimonadaceae bacterium]